ncbi:unnamed protein product [Amoebophrya sp. A25]|nr:unnamed protein product [Amoebophrya sp. A25]|eukprot:GSA25T00003658001.1
MTMYNRNRFVSGQPHDAPSDKNEYESGIRKKFQTLLQSVNAYNQGFCIPQALAVRKLILCDIGCGVYENDPKVVGRNLGQVLRECPDLAPDLEEIVLTGKVEFARGVGDFYHVR